MQQNYLVSKEFALRKFNVPQQCCGQHVLVHYGTEQQGVTWTSIGLTFNNHQKPLFVDFGANLINSGGESSDKKAFVRLLPAQIYTGKNGKLIAEPLAPSYAKAEFDYQSFTRLYEDKWIGNYVIPRVAVEAKYLYTQKNFHARLFGVNPQKLKLVLFRRSEKEDYKPYYRIENMSRMISISTGSLVNITCHSYNPLLLIKATESNFKLEGHDSDRYLSYRDEGQKLLWEAPAAALEAVYARQWYSEDRSYDTVFI